MLPSSFGSLVLGYKVHGELDNQITNFKLKFPTLAALKFARLLTRVQSQVAISFLDGKIPCVVAIDTEQLSILISNGKKKLIWESVWMGIKPTMKSIIQTKLEFDSSCVFLIATSTTKSSVSSLNVVNRGVILTH